MVQNTLIWRPRQGRPAQDTRKIVIPQAPRQQAGRPPGRPRPGYPQGVSLPYTVGRFVCDEASCVYGRGAPCGYPGWVALATPTLNGNDLFYTTASWASETQEH